MRFWLLSLFVLLLAIPAQAGTVVRVGLLTGESSFTVSSARDVTVETPDAHPLDHVQGPLRVEPAPDGVRLGGKLYRGGGVLLSPASGAFTINGKAYRGKLFVHHSDAGLLDAINDVDLEDYVAGVVGGEIPSTWPAEALKAQAVACRSYALAKMSQTRTSLYDVVNSDKDQVYEGVSGARPSIEAAVQATRGQVVTYNGAIVKAYFHAACGGHTEDGQVVFGEQASYLRGVDDPYCRESPYQHWDREYTVQQLRKALEGGGLTNLGQVLSVETRALDPSGRVGQLAVVAEKGEQVIDGVDLRRVLGYRELRSTRFTVRVAKTIPIYYENVQTGPDVRETKVSLIPETIEIGFEETNPQYAAYHIDHPVVVMDQYGKLGRRKPQDMVALRADAPVVVKIHHGIYTVGMDRTVTISRFVVNEKQVTTVTRPGVTKTTTIEKHIPVEFVFDGQGWGHGVGLCQWGCRGMAEQGYNYQQILQHYYPGTTLSIVRSL